MSDNTKFAHRSKESNIENFYKIMSGEKKIITKRDEYEFEASYFAMCLLLPKDSFLKMIEFLGGIEKVKTDEDSIACLARVFNVEHRLVETRISDIISQEKEKQKEHAKSKKLKRDNRKRKV